MDGDTRVDSMMEKFDTRDRKSSARARVHQSQVGQEGELIIGIVEGWRVGDMLIAV